MNNDEKNSSLTDLRKLQPKNAFDKKIGISKVQISKNWKLPPRLKPGRRPQVKIRNCEVEKCTNPEEGDIKKKQNRDAQRAYRERRTNRLQELEGRVSTLQDVVKRWKQRYRDLELELEDVKSENSDLKCQIENMRTKICNVCFRDPCVCESDNDPVTLLQDPFLQNAIKNFKPMKAVSLKRRNLNPPKSVSASLLTSQRSPAGSATWGTCGFCSDSTSCICKDFGEAKEEEPAAVATIGHCSSKMQGKGQCQDCANIDKSCLTVQPSSAAKSVVTTSKATNCDWKPGTCEQCRSDPESKIFCQSICSSAAIMAAVNRDNQDDCSSSLTTEPGSCLRCQADPQRKLFCKAVLSKSPTQSSYNDEVDLDFIPVGHAYQRVRNHMMAGNLNTQLQLPIGRLASGIRVHGREVESKSVDDAIRDMDKNALS